MLAALAVLGMRGGATADEIERGRVLAARLCAACHLIPGQGDKAGASGLPGFKAVANRPTQTFEGVQAWLRSVPPMMPNHHLTQDEIAALASYIMSMREQP